MKKSLRGKLLLGGLALALFAKVAVSIPHFPAKMGLAVNTQLVGNMSANAAEAALGVENTPPPVVAGLSSGPATCNTPEEVLQSLSKERQLVKLQQDQVDKNKSELALAREKLQIEKTSLLDLKGSIEGLLTTVKAQQTDDLRRLIEFYQNMKPADAARIMDDLDIEATIMILGTMRTRAAAPILAKISVIRARAISKIILERSQLPGDQDLVGIRLN